MGLHDNELIRFPVGFERFHRRSFINYQLNRAHSLGYADPADLWGAASAIRSRRDCVPVFEELTDRTVRSGRLRHATSYWRLCEFFTPPEDPEKVARYQRYRDLFDAAFRGSGAVREEIAYAGGVLPSYRMPAVGGRARATVLLHGGFDSLIEEFFAIWQRLAASGYDVIAYEGPGQGGARALGGLTFDHDWEKPVGAVLDHYHVRSAALVGISMGGYWALRAAAHEPRIDRVVAWPAVYDWLRLVPEPLRDPTRVMLRRRRFMRFSIRLRALLSPTLHQVVHQVMYLLDSDDPLVAADWFLAMNPAHLCSDRVTQDVLLMCGEHDAFQPPKLTRAQAEALSSARSVTVRTFTEAEHADQHCQMGNLALACDVLISWLHDLDPREAAPT